MSRRSNVQEGQSLYAGPVCLALLAALLALPLRGQPATTVRLVLPPVSSLFFIEEQPSATARP
jgi:hypothetical protein